jgi:hypothetical protein
MTAASMPHIERTPVCNFISDSRKIPAPDRKRLLILSSATYFYTEIFLRMNER